MNVYVAHAAIVSRTSVACLASRSSAQNAALQCHGRGSMRIAFASGKGGTGKTTISTNVARMLSRRFAVQFLDCDVEEPNAHLFLRPHIDVSEPVGVPVPIVDESKCTRCGKCSELCQFHAIVTLADTTLVFPELCHGCGGCARICPAGAISEEQRLIGVLERGTSRGIDFAHGKLNVGEAMSPPLIRAVIGCIASAPIVIIDSPPGTSCPVVASVKPADAVVLVAEPTPFGLHDLKLAVELIQGLSIPCGVVINRADIGDDRVDRYCAEQGMPIWGRVPHDRRIAEACSRGELIVNTIPEAERLIEPICQTLLERCGL